MSSRLWERVASKAVAGKRLSRLKRGLFLRIIRDLEVKGVDPFTILAWVQVILALIEAAGPLVEKIKQLLQAIRNKEEPAAFARRKGLVL